MNRKRIAKIVASALQEQLGKLFPDFVKASKSIPANNDYERRYNANTRYVKEKKREILHKTHSMLNRDLCSQHRIPQCCERFHLL